MPRKLDDITIIRDSREQNGWFFDEEEKKPGKHRIAGTVINGLDTGDYSVFGHTDLIRVERKNGFQELFTNNSPKENKERFEREVERLSHFPYAIIMIETNLTLDVCGLSVPQFHKSPPVSVLLRWLNGLYFKYKVPHVFVGDAGKKYFRIFIEEALKNANSKN